MSKTEKIQTLHPQGKKGVNIAREKYDFIKDFILRTMKSQDEISYQDLNEAAKEQLTETFDGSVPWYVVTVKLDLEARGIIERVPKSSPHRLRMKTENIL